MEDGVLQSAADLLSLSLAIDPGSHTIRISSTNKGILVDEPACIAVSGITGESPAYGREAYKMIGRCAAGIEVEYPISGGVIRDFDLAELMLGKFMSGIMKYRAFFGVRAGMVVPAGATDVELKAFEDIVMHAGARKVFLVEAPSAAAIGLGLPVDHHRGMVVVCMGAGTTQTAVFSGGAVLYSYCVRVGGANMNETIASGMRNKFGIQLGRQTIEQLKTSLGSAYPIEKDETREVYGKDLVTGLPRAVFVSNWEIREMLVSPLENIVGSVRAALERIPAELSEDVRKNGIHLVGGGAQLRGMGRLIEEVGGVRCAVSKRAAVACLLGAEKVAADPRPYGRFIISTHTRKLTGG